MLHFIFRKCYIHKNVVFIKYYTIRKKCYILLPILFRFLFFLYFCFSRNLSLLPFFRLTVHLLIFFLCHCLLVNLHFFKKSFTFFFFAYIFLIYFSFLSICFLFTLFYIFAVCRSSLTSHLSIFLLLVFISRFPH